MHMTRQLCCRNMCKYSVAVRLPVIKLFTVILIFHWISIGKKIVSEMGPRSLGTQAHKAQSMTEADANMDDRPIIDNYDVSSPDLYISMLDNSSQILIQPKKTWKKDGSSIYTIYHQNNHESNIIMQVVKFYHVSIFRKIFVLRFIYNLTVHPGKCAHGSHFVVLCCCSLLRLDLTDILQGYLSGTWAPGTYSDRSEIWHWQAPRQ